MSGKAKKKQRSKTQQLSRSECPNALKPSLFRRLECGDPGYDHDPSQNAGCASQLVLLSQQIPSPPNAHACPKEIG